MKRIVAFLLVLSIVMGLFPTTAAASDALPETTSAATHDSAGSTDITDAATGAQSGDPGLGLKAPAGLKADVIDPVSSVEVTQTGPFEAEITVSGQASHLVAPQATAGISNTAWEDLVDQYVAFGVNGFAEMSFDHCMEVMAETVYNEQGIWVGLLDELNVEVLSCTYTIVQSEITDTDIELTMDKEYLVLRDGQEQALPTSNRLHLTRTDDGGWYIQSDTWLEGGAAAPDSALPQPDTGVNGYSTGYPNTWTNTGDQATDIAQIALTQVGYKETNNHTKYNAWYYGSDKAAAWCAIFISWCADQAGVSTSVVKKNAVASGYNLSNMGSNSFGAPAYAFGADTPKPGDIAYINNDSDGYSDHVGLVYAVDNNYIYAVEGNYSNKVSQVKYSRSSGVHSSNSGTSILFFARPNYTGSTPDPDDGFSYTLHVWISDTEMGSIPGVFRINHSYYLCYEVYDSDTREPLNTAHPGLSYGATEKVIRPDGSTQFEHTYNNSDGNWIRCKMESTGRYGGVVTLSGGLDLSVDISWTVQDSVTVLFNSWISDSEFGDALDQGTLGSKCYVCYTLVDKASGTPVDQLPGDIDYDFTFSVYRPDGSLLYSYTSSDYDGWISFTPQYPGEYSITGHLDGHISGGYYNGDVGSSFYVAENPPHISSSTSSVNLTLGGTESETIRVTKTGYCNFTWNFAASRSNDNISVSWGDWDGDTCPLTITAQNPGTTTLTLKLKNVDTGEVVDTCTVDVTVTAQYYTISYDANGGSGAPASQTKTRGTDLTLRSDVPTRMGYTFSGWSANPNAAGPSYIPGGTFTTDADTTLYAVWSPASTISDTITSGSISTAIQFANGSQYYQITPASDTSYRFESTGELDTKIFIYDTNGNQLASDDDSGENRNFLLDYTFTAGTTYYLMVRMYGSGTGSIDFTVKRLYGITYDANGGTGAPNSQTKAHGDDITLRTGAPSRQGYRFLGWATSANATSATYQPGDTYSMDCRTTFYAVWEADTCTIRYDANGGSGAPGSQSVTHGTETTLSTTLPDYFGCTFLGWATSPSAYTADYFPGGTITPDGDITLYAVWESAAPIPANVTSSSFSADIPFASGWRYYSLTPAFSGKVQFESAGSIDPRIYLYDANGNPLASDDDDGTDRNFLLTYDVTSGTRYYFKVEFYGSATGTIPFTVKRGYEITYDANGGSGAPDGQTKIHGTSLTLSDAVPTREDCRFLGWATSSTATSATYQPGGSFTTDANTTLYAVWATDSYTIRYDANGGSGAPASQNVTSGTAATLSTTLPTRFCYTFLGWSTSSTAASAAYLPGSTFTTDADVTLYAVWENAAAIPASVVNSSFSADIPFADGCRYYSLTPSFSGKVQLESSGTIDPKIYLYDANGNQLDSDDDAGTDRNFLLTYAVTAGTQYYFKVKFYGSATGTIPFTVKRGYEITYNANGGSNAPDGQTKFHGTPLTLSTGVPTREGHTFLGWDIRSTAASATYQPGGTFTTDAHTTLYAIWETDSYTIRYDANGGTGAPASQTKTRGVPLTLRTERPTRSGYTFQGWATSATASSASYQPGGTFTDDADTTLYAVWSTGNTVIATGSCGSNLTWTLYSSGTLTVSGTGAMTNYTYKSEMPWYSHRSQITSVVLEEGVTTIGDYAFYGMPAMTSIQIPATVTAIGDYAFKNSSALSGVVLPANLSQLGDSAFYACTSLTSIDIPTCLYTIKPYTFKNCTALASVTFHEGNLQKISDGAFYNTALRTLALPDCLDILDVYTFKNCASLTSVSLGSGLTQIREAVFYGTAIPTITIPEGITSIGPYAFKNCTSLESMDLPSTLTSIGEASFYACTALERLDVPNGVTEIGNYAFRKCAALQDVFLGSGLQDIGESSFYGCEGLFYLNIPANVTTIQSYAFKGCTNVEIVNLPDSLVTLGDSAFHTCTSLSEITIPANVTRIGDYCFSGSHYIRMITFEGDAPAIGSGAFNKITATAYYPGSNRTWTASVRQNYGGNITWTAQ